MLLLHPHAAEDHAATAAVPQAEQTLSTQTLAHLVTFYNEDEASRRDKRKAELVEEMGGSALRLSGINRLDWKFRLSEGAFKDEIVDLTTPADPGDVGRAMGLIE